MIYELRIYRFHRNKKKAFLRNFKKSTAFMSKYGITFVAAWENTDRPDEFIWIRSFPSLKARKRATRRYYGSPEWLAIVEMLRPAIRRREVRLMKRLSSRSF
jgi:hypothetical protein